MLITKKHLFLFITAILCFFIFNSVLAAQSFLPVYKRGHGELEVDMKIGGDTDDEKYILNSVTRIAVDSKGNIFALNRGDYNVKKFDKHGKHLITFSERGQGPGELGFPKLMIVDPYDNIIIYDIGNRRFSKFDNGGKFINSIRKTRSRHIVEGFLPGLNDKYIILTYYLNRKLEGHIIHRISESSLDYKNETVIDSVSILERLYSRQPGRSKYYFFYPGLYLANTPSGNFITAFSGKYEFMIYSPSLKLLRLVKHGRARQKVTSRDKNKRFFNIIDSNPNLSKEEKKLRKKEFHFYDEKPYFNGINVDHEGYILVQTYEKKDDNYIYDVFDPEGNFINEAVLPEEVASSVFHGGYLYNRTLDKNDFWEITRYRLK